MSSQKSWSSSSSSSSLSCSNANYKQNCTQTFDEILLSNFTLSDHSTDSTKEMTNGSNANPFTAAAIVHSSAILSGLNFLRENQILCDVSLIAEGKNVSLFNNLDY